MAEQLDLVPQLAAHVDLQDVDADVLAFDGATVSRFQGVAALVVRRVDGARSVRALAEDLAAPPPQVLAAVEGLAALGVVDLTDGSPYPRYRQPRHVGACEDGDQVSVIDLRTGQMLVLGASAAEIWNLVTQTGSLEQTIAELQDSFPDATGLAEDSTSFVEQLVAQGLLERFPGDQGRAGP